VVIIPKKSEGMTVDDIVEVLEGMQEVGDRYHTHLMAYQAQLFCTVAEEVISRFGEKGRKAIIEAVKRFGEERGKRIAELVKSLGKELDLKNLFIYYDFDTTNLALTPEIVDGNVEITITKCPFAQGCKDWGKEEYGRIFCEYVDKAYLRGYNPNLILEIPLNLTKGDKACVHRYVLK
jgi:hypothetical protein